jgi:hypothetical protein
MKFLIFVKSNLSLKKNIEAMGYLALKESMTKMNCI